MISLTSRNDNHSKFSDYPSTHIDRKEKNFPGNENSGYTLFKCLYRTNFHI